MTRPWHCILLLTVGAALRSGAADPAEGFTLNLDFTGGLSPSQVAIFNEAKGTWESYISGYQAGINRNSLDVTIQGSPIDGPGGNIGSGGPTTASGIGGFYIANGGAITLDSADLLTLEVNGALDELALHEIGHVLGFGTLWELNNVYTDGTGQYTGAFGLAAYQDEFDPLASYVPVELGGGGATANGHWNENDGGFGLTGKTDPLGRDLGNELMTGWTGPGGGDTFLSDTTLMSLQDMGFTVHLMPEPSVPVLLALVGLPVWMRRRSGNSGPV